MLLLIFDAHPLYNRWIWRIRWKFDRWKLNNGNSSLIDACRLIVPLKSEINLFLSQSSRGGGGIHLFRSRSDRLSLGRKSTRACSLKFWGTDSIGCRESGYNPRGSQSLSDAMQWDNQQSINQSISTQACNRTINRDFEDHVALGSLRWEVQFGLSWGLILIYGTWQDSTGFYTNNGFLT